MCTNVRVHLSCTLLYNTGVLAVKYDEAGFSPVV